MMTMITTSRDKSGKSFTNVGVYRRTENIPESEATRLLMNRCTGLLLARAQLEQETFTPGAADTTGPV